jgi:hypothetical protein
MSDFTLKLTYRDDNTLSWVGQDLLFREMGPLCGECADCVPEFGQVCEAIATANGARDWYVVNERNNTCCTRPIWINICAEDPTIDNPPRGQCDDGMGPVQRRGNVA